jgi:SMC interacting uncharacterized protein involved in chromosome segregation
MAKATRESNGTRPQQGIEELQQRYQSLHAQRITAEADLKNAQKRLDELKQEARAKYGTDDVEELQRKLQAMREENEQKRSAYQAELDRIEDALGEVEQSYEPTNTSDEAL